MTGFSLTKWKGLRYNITLYEDVYTAAPSIAVG